MFCKNDGCKVILIETPNEIRELCEACQECFSLDNHECKEYRINIIGYFNKCYKCEENRGIRCKCGKKREKGHRLCTSCIKRPPCFSCDGRVDVDSKYIKHCHICVLKSQICSYINCEEPLYGKYCCKQHCCQNDDCLNIINGNSKYCPWCTCIEEKCNNVKVKNSKYCPNHKCIVDGCSQYLKCPVHKCEYEGCYAPSATSFCERHKCKFCTEKVKLYFNYNTWTLSKYCKNHKCIYENCYEKSYKQSEHCWYHTCIVKDCKKITFDLTCSQHSVNTVCKKYHYGRFRNCIMLNLAKLLKNGVSLDMELSLKKLHTEEKLSHFLTFFQKSGKILLYKLRIEGVPKDIKRMIYYKYLEETVKHYFSKYCYDCVEICKESCRESCEDSKDCDKESLKNSEWPGNVNCKEHYCHSPNCGTPKYKNSNYCADHKCGECKELVFKNKKYCNNHLCPLCRTKPCVGKKRYCNRCNCRKYILKDGNHKRCEAPKHNGTKFCADHQLRE